METGVRARLSFLLEEGAAAAAPELRRSGLVVGGLLAGLGGALPLLRQHPERVREVPVALGAILILLALLVPEALRWPHRAWMALGAALGWVNLRLILGAVYALVLTPMALLHRATGADPLGLRLPRARSGAGTWRRESAPPSRERMVRPY